MDTVLALDEVNSAAQPGTETPWGIRNTIKLATAAIPLAYFGRTVLNDVIRAAGVTFRRNTLWLPLYTFSLQVVFFLVILLVCRSHFKSKKSTFSFSAIGFRRTPFIKAIPWALLAFALDYVASTGLSFLYHARPQPLSPYYGSTIAGLVLALAGMAVVGPVVEEVFFRGIIFQQLNKSSGMIASAAISSAIFMIYHVDPLLYGHMFVAGMLYSLLFYKTGSIWPSIAAHSLWNVCAVTLTFAR